MLDRNSWISQLKLNHESLKGRRGREIEKKKTLCNSSNSMLAFYGLKINLHQLHQRTRKEVGERAKHIKSKTFISTSSIKYFAWVMSDTFSLANVVVYNKDNISLDPTLPHDLTKMCFLSSFVVSFSILLIERQKLHTSIFTRFEDATSVPGKLWNIFFYNI